MPYDKSNQSRNDRTGVVKPKWDWLLSNFGTRTAFDIRGSGFRRIAELIKKTNPRHTWNLAVTLLPKFSIVTDFILGVGALSAEYKYKE